MAESSEKEQAEGSVETKTRGTSSTSHTESNIISASGHWKIPLEGSSIFSHSWSPWQLYLAFRRRKIITVEPVLFLYMVATYTYFPLVQQYLLWRFGSEKLQNTSFSANSSHYCISENELKNFTGSNKTFGIVQGQANDIVFYNSLLSSLPSAFAAMIFGPLSDRVGRKPIIIVVAAGAALQALGIIAVIHFNINIYYLLIPSAISGFTGGFASMLSMCFTYIADVSTLKQRTWRIGIVEAMIFAGGALAEAAGGYWLQELDCFFEPPMWLYVGCQGLIIVYVLLYLPESLTRDERLEKAQNSQRGFQKLVRSFKIFFCGVREYSVWRLWAALVAMSIIVINLVGSQLITVFFQTSYPLNWGPKLIGYYGTVSQVSHGLGLIVILPLFVTIGMPDTVIAFIGVLFSAGMNVFIGFVKETWEMFVVGVFQGMEAVISSTLRSIMSKLVTAEDQAALFSFVAATELLCSTIASIVYNHVYPLTLKYNLKSGTTFLLMAILCAIPVPLIVLLFCFRKRKSAQSPDEVLHSDPSERESLLGGVSDSQGHISDDSLNSHNYTINT